MILLWTHLYNITVALLLPASSEVVCGHSGRSVAVVSVYGLWLSAVALRLSTVSVLLHVYDDDWQLPPCHDGVLNKNGRLDTLLGHQTWALKKHVLRTF